MHWAAGAGIRRDKEQTINHQERDKVLRAEWDKDAKTNAETLARDFSAWLQAHKDQLAALTIFYNQPSRRRDITFAMFEDVMAKLVPQDWTRPAIWTPSNQTAPRC
jgi:type I restriction enzyme R subunit